MATSKSGNELKMYSSYVQKIFVSKTRGKHEDTVGRFLYKKIPSKFPKIIKSGITKNDQYFINMERVDGLTLNEMMIKNKFCKFSAQRISKFIYNLRVTIEKMNKLGVKHQDLHWDNVVVNPNNLNFKIIDFGLSKFKNTNGSTVGLKIRSILPSMFLHYRMLSKIPFKLSLLRPPFKNINKISLNLLELILFSSLKKCIV